MSTEELRRLAARRWRVGLGLTAVMVTIYVGFLALVAFGRDLAGTLILGGRVSVGIVLGAAVIVIAAALTGVYVRWANRRYDVELDAIRARRAR